MTTVTEALDVDDSPLSHLFSPWVIEPSVCVDCELPEWRHGGWLERSWNPVSYIGYRKIPTYLIPSFPTLPSLPAFPPFPPWRRTLQRVMVVLALVVLIVVGLGWVVTAMIGGYFLVLSTQAVVDKGGKMMPRGRHAAPRRGRARTR